MIQYELHRTVPTAFPAASIPRIARACSLLKKKYASTDYRIGVVFLSEVSMKRMNALHRGKDSPTDVLSFSAEEGTKMVLPKSKNEPKEMGDIFICAPYARKESKRRGISFEEELVRLFIHGTMHLMGYDHATESQERTMFRIQEEIVEQALK